MTNQTKSSKSKPLSPMAKSAMQKILSLCVGNGFKKTEISLRSFDDRIIKLSTETRIEPQIDAKIREQNGRAQGDQVFTSREEMDKALESLKDNLADNQKIMSKIAEQVQKRKDRGIGVSGEAIDLKTLDQSYVCHTPCNPCRGQGLSQCPKCRGNRSLNCIRCTGRKMVQCVVCGGRKTIAGNDGAPKKCPRCTGHGQIPCDYCRGEGHTACDQCRGQGQIKCSTCKGDNVNSSIATVSIQAGIESKISTQDDFPADDMAQIVRLGKRLLPLKLVKVTSRESAKNEDGLPVINHSLDMPFAEIHLKMGKQDVSASMAGYNPRFLNVPNLLDTKLGPAIGHSGSTKAQLGPIKALQQIGRIKIFREAMMLTAKSGVTNAIQKLNAKYTPLLSPSNVESICLNTNTLLDKATSGPRRVANTWVSLIMIALFAGYYLSPARALAIDMVANIPAIAALKDHIGFALLTLGLALCGTLHNTVSKSVFNAKLGKILPPQYASVLLAKLAQFPYMIYLLTIVYFAVFYVGFDVLGFELPF